MDVDQLRQATKKELPTARYEHTLRVEETAVTFATQMGIDKVRTSVAAILHDYCKFWSREKLISWIKKCKLPHDLLTFNKECWHGPVGAAVAKLEFGIHDEEILDAIRYHTTGRPNMSQLEKIIFLADLVEPGRSFPGVDEIRRSVENDLDQALLRALDHTIMFLVQKKQKIYPLTFMARNDLCDGLDQQQPREESI